MTKEYIFTQVNVWFNGSLAAGVAESLDNTWFYTHKKYVHPKMVLEDENIIILSLNEKYVWFTITPEKVKY